MTDTCIDPDEWVTQAEAARLLGISPQRVQQLCAKGMLRSTRPWTKVALVAASDVAARINQRGES
jgi:hypothetical protein